MRTITGPVPPLVTKPLNWGSRYTPEDVKRARLTAGATLRALFTSRTFTREIEMLLAIGEVCPFYTPWEKNLWIQEADRFCVEFGYYKAAAE